MIVEPDVMEADLAAGRLCCPRCGGPLARWGFARERQVRMLDGVRMVRPRRAYCQRCEATHVLLPATSLITWLTNINVDPQKISIPVFDGSADDYVHGGYYRNVRSTRYEIVGALLRPLDGRSVLEDGAQMPNALEALYITGHSLGGASAAMLAMMLVTEPVYEPIVSKLKAVYTFGQPMITSPQLAEKCNSVAFLREKVIRYVYENDIGPQLPPKESGPFGHFGTEYQYKPQGDGGTWNLNAQPRKQLSGLLQLVANPLSFVARQFTLTRNLPFHASVEDTCRSTTSRH